MPFLLFRYLHPINFKYYLSQCNSLILLIHRLFAAGELELLIFAEGYMLAIDFLPHSII